MPAEIEWRPVTLVKRFAGSAETLTAIQLTSRRDDWKRGAQPPRMRSEQRLITDHREYNRCCITVFFEF